MVDFFSAIQSGVEKSTKVKKSLQEIEGVLNDVSQAVSKFTNGQLKVIKTVYNERHGLPSWYSLETFSTLDTLRKRNYQKLYSQSKIDGLDVYDLDKLPEKLETSNALVLTQSKVQGVRPVIFAKWDQAPAGYPCVITSFYGYEYVCSNKEELNKAFFDILGHPDFSGFLKKAVDKMHNFRSSFGPRF